MNKIKNLGAIFALFFLLWSCDDKKCDDVVCGNNQSCYQGNCYCQDGYEGDNCTELSTDKYVGFYNISMSCQSLYSGFYNFDNVYTDQYPINEITFQNFLNSGSSVKGYIGAGTDNAGNLISIPQQNLGSSATVVSGEGTFQDLSGTGQMQISLQIAQNGQSNVCSLNFYKQ